jgi:uncharacterized surface protein with fasciclin (FAS1) repeats
LLKPENKDQLVTVLAYHVLPGRLTSADLKKAVKDGGGQATFKTVQGEPLTVTCSPFGSSTTSVERRCRRQSLNGRRALAWSALRS